MICLRVFYLFLLLSAFSTSAQTYELIELRNLASGSNDSDAIQINKKLNSAQLTPSLYNGYKSIAILILSKNAHSPLDKIKYFKSGKKLLEESIQSDQTSVELRYLRFCVQTNVPFFLNYSNNIEGDKRMILHQWDKIVDLDLKNRIRNYMLRSEYCNESEKIFFKNG